MDEEQQKQEQEASPKEERQYGIQINTKLYGVVAAIFFVLMIGAGILTRVLPQGAYDRQKIEGVDYVVNGTYRILDEQNPLPIWRWFTAPFEVLTTSTGGTLVILAVLLMTVSGLYAVFDRSGLLKRFVGFLVRKLGKRKYVLLTVLIVFFVIYGSVGGTMDSLPLIVPLVVALSLAMGWDSLVGICMVYAAAIRGFAASTFNPNTVGIAQIIAQVPLYSGLWLRLIVLVITIAAMLLWILPYARKIEKNPEKSLMYKEDAERRTGYSSEALLNIPKQKYPFKEILHDFWKGAMSFVLVLPVVLMISSLSFILTKGEVMDTVVYQMSQVIARSSPTVAALQMLLTTLVVEIFIGGSFIKAYVLMPIFTPLADLVGLSRQIVTQVYIMGDSFANMLYPSDVMLMLVLGMVGCSYPKWFRFSGKFLLAMLAFCVLVIVFAVQVGYS